MSRVSAMVSVRFSGMWDRGLQDCPLIILRTDNTVMAPPTTAKYHRFINLRVLSRVTAKIPQMYSY